jgi:hypothetical protein
VNHANLIKSLVAAGRNEDFGSVTMLPGAGVHSEVLAFSDQIRGLAVDEIGQFSVYDRVAFVKALAAYENSVGGLGSVTALQRVLPFVPDEDHQVFDWILGNTRSYWYYANGAKSFEDLIAIRRAQAVRSAENERKEQERAEESKARRAERATQNLFNAVRRGDTQAVRALLDSGASPHARTPDGTPVAEYASNTGRIEIAQLLLAASKAQNAK